MPEEKTSRKESTFRGPDAGPADDVAPDTQFRTSAVTERGSDVVPVDSVSDVRLADSVSDVKLADSTDVSDVRLAESCTGAAPSFRIPSPPPMVAGGPPKTVAAPAAKRDQTPMALLPGAKVNDFEVVRLLGRGAFGHVYLARQMSLDRLVALKISANRGSEGRTMARLEHQHIVQVFSETVDTDFDQRLLCMQLVPGMGLEKLIGMLHTRQVESKDQEAGKPGAANATASPTAARSWTGAELLEIIDSSGPLPTALDPSALHDREALSKMDAIEATAWFGARLAEALDFAHRHGVLHRDIKPANILVNPYGRPMLADFNISSQPVGSEVSGEEMFGGTFAYMAPEHLDAFNPGDPTGHEAVTAKSDMYSLGLVLQQLLEGRVSIPKFERKAKMSDMLRAMADERRRTAPACKSQTPSARMTLERSLCRCLEPNPDDRFESVAELAVQLDGCRHLREAELRLPKLSPAFTPLLRHPFLWLVILVLLPQVAGSIVNITYNTTQIVGELSAPQQQMFMRLVGIYNAIVYPIAVIVFVIVVRRVLNGWKSLKTGESLPPGEIEVVRRKVLRLPRWIAGLTAFGWFPGGFIFPLAIMSTSFLKLETAAHFLVSFLLSGLIALAYSMCGVEFIALRCLYPALWRDANNFADTAQEELRPVHKQLNRIELFAVMIPLISAIVFLMFGNFPHEAVDVKTEGDPTLAFRSIVAALIVLGILGIIITSAVTNHLASVVRALTNAKD
jgi:eukaryotic-like serine/threonine-protein kinase